MAGPYITQSEVASSIPFDNTSTGALPLVSTDSQSVIEEIWQKVKGASGVTPPFFFGRPSGGGAGTYLQINGVATNKLGQIVIGSNNLIKISVTTSAITTGAVIQIKQRTAVNTFVDISGAQVTIPSGSYSATVTFGTIIALPTNVEISAYIKSGSTSDINLQVYVVAQ
jgi:hypothetical protein